MARGVPECPSPLCFDGRVDMAKNGGIAPCVDAARGEVRARGSARLRRSLLRLARGGDGKVYAASARGVVTVFAAGDALEILARSDLGERIMATPALVGGTVLVRTEERLYAFTARG